MKYIPLILISFFITSCQKGGEQLITKKKDYNNYLVSSPKKTTSKYFELWNSKIKPDSIQLTSFNVVASEYNRFFQNTGNIDFLKKAELALKKAEAIAAIGRPSIQRALSRNYISQHRFKEALEMANASRMEGNGLIETQRLLFDVHMELGNHEMAKKYLDSTANRSDFGYLIRLAKWKDYEGYLEDTITYMEDAMHKAEAMKSKSLKLWSYTNLADYYGHDGRIKDSYEHYLKALEIDPQNAYAKKGIAWIVFSHEKNPQEALRILDSITKDYSAPDYHLLKAEIADYMGDNLKHATYLDAYFEIVNNPQYGDMYNMYNIELYLEETEQHIKAFKLAQKEVTNRPTAESYSFLAEAYLKLGEHKKALDIIASKVDGKTFEPALLYRAAEVYKANGMYDKVTLLKEELKDASYELGPLKEKDIASL